MKPFNGFLLTIAVLFFFQSCGNQQDCDCDIPELRSVTAEEAIIIEAANDFSFDIFAGSMHQILTKTCLFLR
jgi:hypothetical protein